MVTCDVWEVHKLHTPRTCAILGTFKRSLMSINRDIGEHPHSISNTYDVNRCGRIGMMMGLCVLYPQHLFAFQLVACLEIAGCWSNHYRCALLSNQHQVFQKTRATDPWILKIFFQEPICSFAICGQDTCVAMCYLLHFSPGPTVTLAGSSHSLWRVLAWLGVPFFVYRQVLVCGLLILTSFGELARLHHQQSWTLNKNTSAFRDKRD
ncbi:CDP-diacylglycerol--inositol 3-phosphatidyltransferase-like [Montipora foliosa]|uniref:CDP-diacylglycerol--inositol 3-phosphatidyltransferase-like n=1 Tax=Montipora foliosa TaxID=591990 RepID=UPI0035F1F3C6